MVTPVDPDSSFEKCSSVDVLTTHLPLENINMGLHIGVVPACSLKLEKKKTTTASKLSRQQH